MCVVSQRDVCAASGISLWHRMLYTEDADAAVSAAGSLNAAPSPPTSSSQRHNASTSTPSFHKGGDIQYHLRAPSLSHLVFLLGTPLLCFLNGCSYYLFWRSRYFEEASSPQVAAATTPAAAATPFFPLVVMASASSSAVAPSAFYGVTAGFAFAFIVTQWVIQESAHVFVCSQTERARSASFRRCGVLFVVAFLPLTIAQMVLISQDYHLCKGAAWLLRLEPIGSVAGTSAVVRATLSSSASHRYAAVWIVSFVLTTTSMVVILSAMWTDAAVSWLQRRVFAAYLAAQKEMGQHELS